MECHKIANLKELNFPAPMISCLTELRLYRLIIYIDGHILCCTHSLFCIVKICLLLDSMCVEIYSIDPELTLFCSSNRDHSPNFFRQTQYSREPGSVINILKDLKLPIL